MTELDHHEKLILRFIERYENQNGRAPTYEEIRQGTGMSSKDHVHRDVETLEERSYVRREPAISRGIMLLRTVEGYPVTPFSYSIPVIAPVLERKENEDGENEIQDWIEIARAMIPDAENVCAFRVQGNKMIDALVNDGDLIIIKRQSLARNGELVAVRIARPGKRPEFSLKRYYRYDGEIWLQPENPELESVKYDRSEVKIQGLVLCIIRHMPNENSVKAPRRRAA